MTVVVVAASKYEPWLIRQVWLLKVDSSNIALMNHLGIHAVHEVAGWTTGAPKWPARKPNSRLS